MIPNQNSNQEAGDSQMHEMNPTLRNYYRLQQGSNPPMGPPGAPSITGQGVAQPGFVQNQPPPSSQIAENFQALQNQQNISNMSRLCQFYMQQCDSRPQHRTSFADRKRRAERLLGDINRLKKPQTLEKLSSLVDCQRILQTLLNTEHIENQNRMYNYGQIGVDVAGNQNRAPGEEQASQPVQDRNAANAGEEANAEATKTLSESQIMQNALELEEARIIMNKRRKRMPLVEEVNLDDIFSEDQKEQLLKPKRQKTSSDQTGTGARHLQAEINSKMSETTDDEDSGAGNLGLAPRSLSHLTPSHPLPQAERETLKGLLQERCVQASVVNSGLLPLQNAEPAETRLANLKESCSCMLINYLTASGKDLPKIEQAEDHFFNQVVAERHPELLVDVSDYWLNQIRFKIPTKIEQSAGGPGKSVYLQNLAKILPCLQKYKGTVLHDKQSFSKWLKLVKYVPKMKEEQELVRAHIEHMMNFANFSQATLEECVGEFIKDFIVKERQIETNQKMELFALVYKQMLSPEQDPKQFRAISNLLLTQNLDEKDEQASKGPLLCQIDAKLQRSFKDYLCDKFAKGVQARSMNLGCILSTYVRYCQIKSETLDPEFESLVRGYIELYSQSSGPLREQLLHHFPQLFESLNAQQMQDQALRLLGAHISEDILKMLVHSVFSSLKSNESAKLSPEFTNKLIDVLSKSQLVDKSIIVPLLFNKAMPFSAVRRLIGGVIAYPKLDTSESSTSIFSLNMAKVVKMLQDDDKRFKVNDKIDERQEILHELLLQAADQRDTMQRAENQKLLLQRQIKITDGLVLAESSDLLLSTLQLVVERKNWHCKVLIRTILILNKSDETNEKGYFDKTKQMIQKMMEQGNCSKFDDKGLRENIKKGLYIYFDQSSQRSLENKKTISELFNNWKQDPEFKGEMIKEYENLKNIIEHQK